LSHASSPQTSSGYNLQTLFEKYLKKKGRGEK
jgi:hypothetical protein